MKPRAIILFLLLICGLRAGAQYPTPMANGVILNSDQLQQLLGPIALYPDPLIAEILPAATQPSEIAVAYNYVSQGGDPNGIDAQPWDGSVKALARYPDVLKMLDSSIPWTSELGQAFLNQPTDVMNSIQYLRAQAQNLGNLQSTPQDTIIADDGEIDIVPTDPELIYVPYYDPGIVFYQRAYGRPFFTWGIGFHIGPWLTHDFDWHDHHVIVWGNDHPRPANWWHERPVQRREVIKNVNVWHSGPRDSGNRTTINRTTIINRGGDRGYAGRQPERSTTVEHPTQPGKIVRTEPTHVEPSRQPAQVQQPRQAPTRVEPSHPVNNVQTHVIQSRPSAFVGAGNATETRAASSRGEQSRQMTVSRPAPAPETHSAPASAPSRGGGGGNNRR